MVRIEGDLPLLKAAVINALRRDIAEKLQSLECNFRPILNVRANAQASCPDVADYRNDVANGLAAEVYRSGGSRFVYPAYELSVKGIHPEWGDRETSDGRTELMRSRYCLLRELGYCKKTPAYRRLAAQNRVGEGIFIRNNSRMLMLDFDCSCCEMTVCPVEMPGRGRA